MAKKSALQKIYDLIEAIRTNDPSVNEEAKESKASMRRIRVSLGEIKHLCVEARKQLLGAMKKK